LLGFEPTRSCIKNLVAQWGKNHSVNPEHLRSRKGVIGRPRVVHTAHNLHRVQVSVALSPKKSLKRRTLELDMARTSLQRFMKKILEMTPYRIRIVQKLHPDDPERRLFFIDIMIGMFNTTPIRLHYIWMSDEAKFCLNGCVTPANYR
jgi:hypothetical protein